MYEIIPGILEKDWAEIEKKLELVKPFAKTVHIDILDGKFAPNTTFLDPTPFKKYSDSLFLEVHLMVEEPLNYLKPFADAGFKRFIGHVEKMSDQVEFVAQGQLLGEVALAFDGDTSIDAIKVPLDDLDYLLIMTIKAGFSGQSFDQKTLEKIKLIREKSALIPIEVDGGINDQTILLARDAGANKFSATSFIYKGDPYIQFKILNELVNKQI
ncbi:MAG: ribulose-phosphate 3-epimerase [Candidatus Levyibacteriota bacterium]